MLAISSSSISTTGQSLNRNRKVHKLVALEKEELCRQWTKKRLKLSICMLSGKRKLVPRVAYYPLSCGSLFPRIALCSFSLSAAGRTTCHSTSGCLPPCEIIYVLSSHHSNRNKSLLCHKC